MPRRRLSRIWQGWKRIAHAIGVFQTKVILTVFYFLVLGLFALAIKILRRDLLSGKPAGNPGYWNDLEMEEIDMERCRRQF